MLEMLIGHDGRRYRDDGAYSRGVRVASAPRLLAFTRQTLRKKLKAADWTALARAELRR